MLAAAAAAATATELLPAPALALTSGVAVADNKADDDGENGGVPDCSNDGD